MFAMTTYLVILVAIIFISDVLFGFGFRLDELHVVPAESTVTLTDTDNVAGRNLHPDRHTTRIGGAHGCM